MTSTDPPLSEIPERYEDVTVEWLETALRGTGTISPETRLSAFELEPLKLDTYRISSVARIGLEYDSPLPEPGRPAAGPPALIAKFVSRDTRGRESIKDQANFQYEEQVYRQLSDRIPLRIPGIYYGAQGPDSDLGVVMIEEIRGAHVRDEAGTDRGFTVSEARLALSEIAKLHGRWWASKSLWELPWLRSWVHVNGRKRPRRFASRWESVRDLVIDVCSPTEMSLFDAMLRVFTRAFKTVESMPFTLCHGDFHSGNLLWDRLHSPSQVWFLDWQELHRGPVASELAFFLGWCTESEEAFFAIDELLGEYHAGLRQAGVTDYSLDQLRSDLRPALIVTIARQLRVFANSDPADEAAVLELQRIFRQDAALADIPGCAEWVRSQK